MSAALLFPPARSNENAALPPIPGSRVIPSDLPTPSRSPGKAHALSVPHVTNASSSVIGRTRTADPSSEAIDVPIAADTPYLHDAEVGPFRLPLPAHPQTSVTLQMVTTRRQEEGTQLLIPFGQKRSVTIELVP